ncbi:superinfection immunity protein [Fangia hongkongensis]|uniref:superinfection immunity protein n=1 Tax=Fangia hongkongensis TaxID=270495 RepID=UPI0003676855|nr:superinfection immunity protein [Fangia hongkongensis]MBK2126235.1 superinfection immunity protein [Fangia hongkongensis]
MRVLLNLLLFIVVVLAVLWFLPFSLFLVLAFILLLLYFLPSYIAFKKHHPNSIFIFIINLLFGFTLIVWLVCLILAIVYNPPVKVVEHHYHN